jgi:hypothetical protein
MASNLVVARLPGFYGKSGFGEVRIMAKAL